MRTSLLLLPLLLVACPKDSTESSTPSPAEPALDAAELAKELPFDEGVRSGVLDNGLRWFVEENDKPEDRVVFRLVIDAGSVLEEDDQQGLAHLLEHMAFNGSENFSGNDLIQYLEGVGTKFGPHLNAHTSFDETVYKLQVPSDDPEIVDKAFLVLDDWAHGLSLDEEEIEKERGVVLEEWRRGLGPGRRAFAAHAPLGYVDAPYPERLPIGTEESLKSFEPEAVRRFYADWYRPDLMSVIVVGSIDPELAEKKILEHFGDIEMPEAPSERLRPAIGTHDEPVYSIFSDPEITRTSISVSELEDWVHENTVGRYRDGFVSSAFFEIFSERGRDLAQDPDAPFLGMGATRQRLSPTEGAWAIWIAPKEGRELEAYRLLLTELKRIQDHGVLQAELDRSVKRQLKSLESYYDERETTESVVHARELVRHVTTNEPVPGIAMEWELAQTWLPTLTVEEVSAFAADFLDPKNRLTEVNMPEKEGLKVPDEEAFSDIQRDVATMELEPWFEAEVVDTLIEELPAPGTIESTETNEALGFTIWTLSNGVEVWAKPTDFETEQILLRGRSVGGTNLASDEDFVAASTAVSVAREGGLGALDSTALRRAMAGREGSAGTWIGSTHEGVSGTATPDDIELMFQQVYLGFTEPRFDLEAMAVEKAQRAESLRNRLLNPSRVFEDAWKKVLWNDFERYSPWTEETLDEMDLEASQSFYEDRFADASDFQFAIVGNLDMDTLKPLVEQYLASLPTADREVPDARKDLGARRIEGPDRVVVRAGSDPKAKVTLTWHGPFESTFTTRNRLLALDAVLSTRLREVLREEKSGVYGVSVGTGSDVWPEPHYRVTISFVCDPERVDELEAATREVLAEIKAEPVDQRYIDEHIAKSLRSREEKLKDNGFWVGLPSLTELMDDTNESIDQVMDYEDRVRSLTAEELHEHAQDWIQPDKAVVGVLLPEASEE